METMVGSGRSSEMLPSINYREFSPVKGHGSEYRSTTLPVPNGTHGDLASPTSLYSGPPPPYSYQSTTSNAPSSAGIISPPESRRTSGDDKDDYPQRQSLPSIFEALGRTEPLTYPVPPPPLLSHERGSLHESKLGLAPRSPIPRSQPLDSSDAEARPGVSHATSAPAYPAPAPHTPATSAYPPPSMPERLPSLHSLRTAVSPGPPQRASTRPALSSQPSPTADRGPASVAAINTSYAYHAPAGGHRFAGHSTTNRVHSPTTPHAHTPYTPRFHGAEVNRVQEAQQSYEGFKGVNGERYGTAVKRHLDYFDLEASLNEIADSSGRVNEFSRDFKDRARELPRTGPVQGALPSIAECDEMIKHQNRVQDLLTRLREMLVTQHNAAVNQQGSESRFKTAPDYELDEAGAYEEGKVPGLLGPDAKKRRGRAAPPGRCHSCNRAETPEWRRGPDGARTLCNACGLHYAKLTRKKGAKSAATSSALRPKSMGPVSPS